MNPMLKIENKTGRVKLDDTVDAYSRRELAKEMAKVFGAEAFSNPEFTNLTGEAANQVDRLEIEINSPGGSVFDGMMIVNELKAMSGRGVRTVAIVNVLAASMGSVIAASCDECQIVENGKMMIHDVSAGVRGTSKDLSRMAALCESMSNEIAGIYALKTGKTTDEMRALMLDETWLDAAQCITIGLADSVFDFRAPASNISDMSLIARLTNPAAPEAIEQINGLQARVTELETDLTAAASELQEFAATVTANDETIAAQVASIESLSARVNEADRLANENAQLIAELQASATASATAHAAAIAAAESTVAQLAVEMAACAGIEKPLGIAGGSTDAKSINRSEFAAMNPAVAMSFIKSGGKISD